MHTYLKLVHIMLNFKTMLGNSKNNFEVGKKKGFWAHLGKGNLTELTENNCLTELKIYD